MFRSGGQVGLGLGPQGEAPDARQPEGLQNGVRSTEYPANRKAGYRIFGYFFYQYR